MRVTTFKLKAQYVIWQGELPATKIECDTLGEVINRIYQAGHMDHAAGSGIRMRVFDREPYMQSGGLFLVWDSKHNEVK